MEVFGEGSEVNGLMPVRRESGVEPPALKIEFLLRVHWDQAALSQAHGDGVCGDLGFPAHFPAIFDDDLDHVRAEYAGALGDDHLAVRIFVEFDTNFGKAIGAAFCPTVLEIVETENFAFLEREGHGGILIAK